MLLLRYGGGFLIRPFFSTPPSLWTKAPQSIPPCGAFAVYAKRFKMPAACALGIFSGKIIFNRAMPERLRTLRHCIFTGGGVEENGSCSAAFCESVALRESFWQAFSGLNSLSQSLTALPAPSGREPLAWRESFRLKHKACGWERSPWGSCRAATEGLQIGGAGKNG